MIIRVHHANGTIEGATDCGFLWLFDNATYDKIVAAERDNPLRRLVVNGVAPSTRDELLAVRKALEEMGEKANPHNCVAYAVGRYANA